MSVAVVAIFALIYLLTGRAVKPLGYTYVPDEEFENFAKRAVGAIPDKKTALGAGGYTRLIGWTLLKAERKKYDGLATFIVKNKIFLKELCKRKYDCLLPAAGGEARAVTLAKAALNSAGGKFVEERVAKIFEVQNALHTLTFCEIMAMKDAFMYAILENVARLASSVNALLHAYDIAQRYVKSLNRLPKRYAKLSGSPLFLSICARIADYRSDEYGAVLQKLLCDLEEKLTTLMSSCAKIAEYDFSRYYTPLEVYAKYDVFACAGEDRKRAFLSLAAKLSDRENVDEFIYAVRVDKYMHSASAGHTLTNTVSLFGFKLGAVRHREDISMLAAALGNMFYMDLFFADTNKSRRQSISKNSVFENSFEPIYRFHTVNFGISTKGGRLKVSPHLPLEVVSADIAFWAGDALNTLRLERGENKELYLNGTKLVGTDEIRLSGRPLEIRVVIPFD